MKRFFSKLLLVAGGMFVALLVAEIGLRIAGVSYPGAGGTLHFYTWDSQTGMAFRPGAHGEYRREGDTYLRMNSQGLRDREHTKKKPSDTFRIAVLGDSFAAAFQVPIQQAFWSVLERDLAGCPALNGRKVEAINFGVIGFGTAQELIMLRDRVWDYSPDLILLAFFTGNDVQNNSRALQKDPYRPYFVLDGDKLTLDDSFLRAPGFKSRMSPTRRFLSSAVTHSRLLQIATLAIESRSESQQADELGLDDAIYRPPTDPKWQEAWQITEDLVVQMRNEVASHGAKFLVVTLSNGIQVDPDPAVREQYAKRLGVDNLFYPDFRVKALAEREGIPVLTLAPAFQQYAEQHHTYLHGFRQDPGRGHWNEEGHRLAGQMMAQKICSEKLFP
ncbi:MAG TPA: SGNH/GDSL hydrolase family protein [Terriglobia bacterium]|nr:SGNH/GDSL hydrolase family protein [Terriglobia bacterium]